MVVISERLARPLTDAAGSVKPTTQKLIPADSLRLQFYDGTRWQESWSSVQAIPVAVRITLHSPQWGEIERIWLLRGPQLSSITSPPKRGMALVVVLVLLAVIMLVTITLSGRMQQQLGRTRSQQEYQQALWYSASAEKPWR